jgi:hypothetical protein
MKASEMLAERAQQSAVKMESMTERMYEIADKTKQETVSMRIITLVTLFFLPGTFISVSSNPYLKTNRAPIDFLPDSDEHRHCQIPQVKRHKQAREGFRPRSFAIVFCNHFADDAYYLLSVGCILLVGDLEGEIEVESQQPSFQFLIIRSLMI